MNSVAIIILNFETYHQTEKCVDSIIRKGLDISGIVVVDNASANDSFSHLYQKYKDNKKIKVIKSNRNVGFAKGNNLGIKVAKKLWKPDFILLLNSDTVILECNYLQKLLDKYEPKTGVMQSSVLRLNGRYTQKNYGVYDLKGIIFETIRDFCFYENIYLTDKIKYNPQKVLGPWVSGCDILLTPHFFKIYKGLYPFTFLYGEEYILAIMLKKAGLKWLVVEDAHILHAESKSTPISFKEGTRKKQRLMLGTKKHKLFVRILPFKILRLLINYEKAWRES